MRRSLIVLGVAMAVLILGFVTLFATGGGRQVSGTGGFQTLPTTTTMKPGPTTTTIITLKGQNGTQRFVVDLVVVPNVVGLTLAQADTVLSEVGLSSGISTAATKPSGASATGTVLAQAPTTGSRVSTGQVIQLTVSGY